MPTIVDMFALAAGSALTALYVAILFRAGYLIVCKELEHQKGQR